MKLANKASLLALMLLAFVFAVTAQTTTQTTTTARPERDNRNTAPTVGTGGTPGGPTGLFTIYDGQTLRKGEFTFSAAYSNYDRDPGDVDITEIPVSFQVGLTNHLEVFFNTDAYRGVKVNNPYVLSSFRLPNSQLVSRTTGLLTTGSAIVLAPQGTTNTAFSGTAVFRPAGTIPFTQFPFVGSSTGTFGLTSPLFAGTVFGFPTTTATFGATATGGGAANFPGIGSVYGSILPGIVLQTASISGTTTVASSTVPTVFTTAPVYLPDAPFINRTYGQSAFSTFTAGAKFRLNSLNSPYGLALIPFYRFYADKADDFSGFNQLQRGASPGSSRGDFGLVVAGDARLASYVNLSGNVGYIHNGSVKADIGGTKYTILDRGDEFNAGVGVDFPVNKYFQPILEAKYTKYVGGRTPNAFENDPIDALAGVRIFPTRYFGMSFAYRYNANQQDRDSFDSDAFTSNALLISSTGTTAPIAFSNSFSGVPSGFTPSTDPHGYIFQVFAGRRNKRAAEVINLPANVTAVNLNQTTVTIGCAAGLVPREGTTCNDSQSVSVSTTAADPENDVLTYNYTVSGGRITGQGANVTWDLAGAKPGTYTITAGVDDGCGVCGQTKTQTVTVAECECVAPPPPTCECATISVSGPSGVTKAGEPVTFTANVSGGSQTSSTYNWTVSSGTISSGQGTSSITVDTTGLAGQNVTATVDVGGLCPSCPTSDSETAGIAPVEGPVSIDEFGPLQDDDVKARVDNFYIQLQNDPTAQGYIINYGTAKEIAKRRAQINKAIKFLRKDAGRVTFVDGGDQGAGVNTKFFLVPAGATPPTP